MPAKSKAQLNLMRAAKHGATFPKATAIRQSMTLKQLDEYTKPASRHLPRRVR